MLSNRESYARLADVLNEIPNGFPRTESGVELKLLAKLFAPEEADTASAMNLIPETAEQISSRTGQGTKVTVERLNSMRGKGLIGSCGSGEDRKFYLIPFVVGFYENQQHTMDREFAQLFDDYYSDFAEGVLGHEPPIHRVIAVERSISIRVNIHPYEEIRGVLDGARSIVLHDCVCRIQKRLVGQPCRFPEKVCIAFSQTEGAFDPSRVDLKIITKEEALELLRKFADAGMVHTTADVKKGHYYICNCCTCCCGILRGIAECGVENSVGKSNFYASVDAKKCTGCETCLDRCQFGAVSVDGDVSEVDLSRCFGCGVCTLTCPSEAITLIRKPERDLVNVPLDEDEWREERAKNRSLPLNR